MEFSSSNIRSWSRMGSAGTFGVAMDDLANTMPALAVLTADLKSYSGLSDFAKRHPAMFYNVGISEQNMVGVACGMAKEGLVPFATTYASFATTRCLDQVRVGMGYMELPVKLVGLAAGYALGALGATHMACEDVAIMRAIPNIVILSPADCTETVKALHAAALCPRPVYVRLSGGLRNPPVYKSDFDYKIGQANWVKQGDDVILIATGTMVGQALRAAKQLEKEHGLSAAVVDMHTIRPLDGDCIRKIGKAGARVVATVEEHSVEGGLGSAIEEFCVQERLPIHVLKIGTAPTFRHANSYGNLLQKEGLDGPQICEAVVARLDSLD